MPTLHVDKGKYGDYRFVDDEEESDWLDLSVVDVEAEAESMRQESKDRLRVKSNELKRFHDKICVRVTARERQNRLEAQKTQKCLDAKCAKLFSTTESTQQTESTAAVRISTRPYFQELKEQKRAVLKSCPLGHQIEKSFRLDAQIRDELLQSTQIARSVVLSNDLAENTESETENKPTESPTLLPEQRVALYALVRRQYMEMNRAKAQSNVWRGASQSPSTTKAKSPISNSSVAAAVSGSRARRASKAGDESGGNRWTTSAGVEVVDISSGCEARAHRQTTTSSTPWRKKTKSATRSAATKDHERYVRALQAQLGTPALCSCGKDGQNSISSPHLCANNCALYKQPKKREKLLVSVYKQQQQDTSAAATSPMR
ncbi:hypothetical protein KRP22_008855 [Phytophthora ramorum]|nr:hypothetical protein KRP22_7686 [Phytophthora ramorum]